jgi:hypothetical protein
MQASREALMPAKFFCGIIPFHLDGVYRWIKGQKGWTNLSVTLVFDSLDTYLVSPHLSMFGLQCDAIRGKKVCNNRLVTTTRKLGQINDRELVPPKKMRVE